MNCVQDVAGTDGQTMGMRRWVSIGRLFFWGGRQDGFNRRTVLRREDNNVHRETLRKGTVVKWVGEVYCDSLG